MQPPICARHGEGARSRDKHVLAVEGRTVWGVFAPGCSVPTYSRSLLHVCVFSEQVCFLRVKEA